MPFFYGKLAKYFEDKATLNRTLKIKGIVNCKVSYQVVMSSGRMWHDPLKVC